MEEAGEGITYRCKGPIPSKDGRGEGEVGGRKSWKCEKEEGEGLGKVYRE